MKFSSHRRRIVGALVRIPTALLAVRVGLAARQARAGTAGTGELSSQQLATLERICFLLFPYPGLGMAPYDRVAASIAQGINGRADAVALLARGIDGLDEARASPWIALDEDAQLEALHRIETGPFFQYVLDATKARLFNDPKVWAHIGYEGSSLEFGGYLDRGLNDIDWLDEG